MNHTRESSLHYLNTEELNVESLHSMELPESDDPMFGFVMKESVKVSLESETKRRAGKVLSGELFFIPPNCRCMIENNEGGASQVIIIRFRSERSTLSIIQPSVQKFRMSDEFRLYSFRMPQIRSWIQDFMSDCGHDEPVLYYQLQSHLYAMASAFILSIQKSGAVDDDLIDYVEQTKLYMLEQYYASMDIEEIARLSGLSPNRFYQSFRRHTGLSPHKFITTIRLNASLCLLSNTPSSVMDVAHSVGYSDELYFSRLFKKHMGMSPTEYAASARIRIANLSPVFQGDLSVLGITPKLTLRRGWSDYQEKYVHQIASCKPELILTSPIPEDLYRRLSQIAPVVMLHWKGMSWKERLLNISQTLGLSTVAERWLSYFDMKVENARFHIRRQLGNEPFLLVGTFEDQYRVFGMQHKKMRDLFYDDLQVTPPARAGEVSFLKVMTLSEVASLDCNNVLFLVPTTASEQFCVKLEEDWRRLKRNRQDKHCLFIRYDEPLLYNPSMHESLLDQTVNQLLLTASK
ncbi:MULTISPECIES: helix-turn-helix domain-containing protein [unclassified Paenibacillus]|uniref:helix-turn-helix domain-containing protein n=1 Tax=unclassified Paenibacillus TaxID=185978 RepID=UPI001AE18C28|nr:MULTISPECIES: helix-turn-helix domain-containing protein [unclassified Paenibacillus]MBP1156256.1 AraC-like DNA-binding protein [Paenibacillus sp. PvP091]MBP1168358.1 AraC-like DNA-binding protein [Paenibacillus sp. PvR098]MBP2439386.1 AraC-like DNA-binding protein [Paenibacillus sp. PvP052]